MFCFFFPNTFVEGSQVQLRPLFKTFVTPEHTQHPSLFYIALSNSGWWDYEADLSWIRAKAEYTLDMLPVHHRGKQWDRQSHALTFTASDSSEPPINLKYTFLGPWRKWINPRKTQCTQGKKCKLQTDKKSLWQRALTASPLCSHTQNISDMKIEVFNPFVKILNILILMAAKQLSHSPFTQTTHRLHLSFFHNVQHPSHTVKLLIITEVEAVQSQSGWIRSAELITCELVQ